MNNNEKIGSHRNSISFGIQTKNDSFSAHRKYFIECLMFILHTKKNGKHKATLDGMTLIEIEKIVDFTLKIISWLLAQV